MPDFEFLKRVEGCNAGAWHYSSKGFSGLRSPSAPTGSRILGTTFEQISGSLGHRLVSWLFGYQHPFSIKQQADRTGLFKELLELREKLSGYTDPLNENTPPRLLLRRIAELEKFLGTKHSPWWTKSKWVNHWERLCAGCRDFES